MAAFTPAEYADRLARTRARMAAQGLDHLLVGDPANIYYLTGFDTCSFYAPQLLVVSLEAPLRLLVRHIDASSAWLTANLAPEQVFGYPEPYVQRADVHPMDWMASTMRPWFSPGARVGVESESSHYAVRSHLALVEGFGGGVSLEPCRPIVNWVRAVKSPAEITVMRTAGRITERVFEAAFETVRPGVRQADAVAEIYAAQIRGLPEAGGSYAAIPPIVLAGSRTALPHVPWTDEPFAAGEAVALELAGARLRYHVPLTRTLFLGEPPREYADLSAITGEGLEAALAAIRPGEPTGAPADAWNAVISRHGYAKSSRVGYPVGIGYAPDWGEQTMSLRSGEATPFAPGMTFHVMIGMWLEGRGYSISETVLVTPYGVECLTDLPRGLWVCDA